MPVSPTPRYMWATKLQKNITIPPIIAAIKIRIFSAS
jgi:hypothetical protein